MRERARTAASFIVVLGGLGCASAPPPRAEAPRPDDKPALVLPRIRILDPQLAAERSASSETVTMPYGVNQNGTELVYALLERAAHEGARYVSDLSLYATFRWRGTPVECRTRVLLEGDPRLAERPDTPVAAPTTGPYATDVSTYRPQRVELVAEDRELVCRRVPVAMNKWRRIQDAERTADAARLARTDPESRELVTVVEERELCEWKPVTRPATRYDYEVKLGFTPPNWEHLQAKFARRRLVPTAPTCYALAESEVAARPAYRMTATAYRRGKVTQRLPDVLPSRGMIAPENVKLQAMLGDKHVSEKVCSCNGVSKDPAQRLEHLLRIHHTSADAIDYADVDVAEDEPFRDDE